MVQTSRMPGWNFKWKSALTLLTNNLMNTPEPDDELDDAVTDILDTINPPPGK
jgi:hypothetical protein